MDAILNQAKKDEANCDKIRRAHYIAWEKQSRWNLMLGIPVVILTAAAGTMIFSSCQFTSYTWLPIFAGGISFLATLLSALQTFLKLSEKAEAHKASAAHFAAMKRAFKLFQLEYSNNDESFRDQAMIELKALNAKLDFYAEHCIALPDHAMSQAGQEQAEKARAGCDEELTTLIECVLVVSTLHVYPVNRNIGVIPAPVIIWGNRVCCRSRRIGGGVSPWGWMHNTAERCHEERERELALVMLRVYSLRKRENRKPC
ncbi:MAG: SLATT domain-containing protein [Pseudomonadota bacterium]